MRVWALASCGSLLALAACSADQTNTANPNSPTADGDAPSQETLPPTATPRPLARPELPSQQTLSARPRLNPAAVSGGARTAPQAQSQSEQLQARLQRLRAQQGARQVSSAPIAAAPTPAPAEIVASPIPQPGAPMLIRGAATPGPSRGDGLTIARQPHSAEQSPLAVVPTPLPSTQPPVAKADVESSDTGADLQPVVAASIASNYPIAPLRHQGHSARQSVSQSARSTALQVLVPPPTAQPIAAGARLHHVSTAPALAAQPRGSSAAPASEAEATGVPDSTQAAADLRARAPETALSRGHAVSQPRAGSPVTLTHPGNFPGGSPAEGAHQQESTAPLRSVERLPLQASLAPRPDSRTTRDQGLGAIALPESLPLNSAAPRLSPQRPQLSPARPTVSPPTADRTPTEPAAVPFAVSSGGHLSPTDQDGFHLVPSASQSPKGLPLAHCPPASAHTPTADRLGDGAIAPQPSFSGGNPSMIPDTDAPLADCWSNATTQSIALEPIPAADPVPDDPWVAPASVADVDLENLAPAPAAE